MSPSSAQPTASPALDPTTTRPRPPAGEPYCSNCGYHLTGLTTSSVCPECGRPLVEVLTRDPLLSRGARRYTSNLHLFGLPLVHVAMGPGEGRRVGYAKGIIAVGDISVGVISVGNIFSLGVVSVGGGSA
ncbi:MAG: hypothetical protein H7Y88_03275, partial [Phycisphaerales bacterium]|nr:hypothetical protein [Phycisphaerales bacterium]